MERHDMKYGLGLSLVLMLSTVGFSQEVEKKAPTPVAVPASEDELYRSFRELFYSEKVEEVKASEAALLELEKRFPGSEKALDARKRFDAPQKTKAGLKAYDFSIENLDNPKEKFSLKSFQGKYLLLEFWATWCPYCVKDMPEVEGIWAKHKNKKFEILSFSLDKNPAAVKAFRASKHAMPWNHAFLPGMKSHPIAENYGAAGIPKYVLIDPVGRICAAGNDLKSIDLDGILR